MTVSPKHTPQAHINLWADIANLERLWDAGWLSPDVIDSIDDCNGVITGIVPDDSLSAVTHLTPEQARQILWNVAAA